MAGNKIAWDMVQMNIDMSGVIKGLGAVGALNSTLQTAEYLDLVIDNAFDLANKRFLVEAEAYAMATGDLGHMYEWGTIGVNKWASSRKMKANTEEARLWHTEFIGNKGDRVLTWQWKPSFTTVPVPTKKDTGMSTEVIKKLKSKNGTKYIFHQKARIMEMGESVRTKFETGSDSKFLLFPAWEWSRADMRPEDVRRGYAITKKTDDEVKPGNKAYQGNFTYFWMSYWEGRGAETMQAETEITIFKHFAPEFSNVKNYKTVKQSLALDPKARGTLAKQVKAEAEAIKRKIMSSAKARSRNNEQ
jgi:hypothetical protein